MKQNKGPLILSNRLLLPHLEALFIQCACSSAGPASPSASTVPFAGVDPQDSVTFLF